ncbi:hypothetical protein OF83DRAFT_1176741 [Amylostereum chailletii]|nr:hypothetical protein OF83DRAFT_1176741 [Amylostereum chailletii]
MDTEGPDDSFFLRPIPALSTGFLEKLDGISSTAAENMQLAYGLVYSACMILLREDQLLATANYHEGLDTVLVARTGSGKTMQIIIAALMNPPGKIVLVMSPLKRLQNSMAYASKISWNYLFTGLYANMRYNSDIWLGIANGAYSVILTSPEQCGVINGHTTQLQKLLKDSAEFRSRICRLIVDEAHLVYIWGLPTTPPRIVSAWEKTLRLRDNYVVLRSTCNRSNQVYAVHTIFGDLKNFANLGMLVPRGIETTGSVSLEDLISRLPKTFIFMDSIDLIRVAPKGLYLLFPLWIRPTLIWRNVICMYHSGMSRFQLDKCFFPGKSFVIWWQ